MTKDDGIPVFLQVLLDSLELHNNDGIIRLCTEKSIFVVEDSNGIRLSEGAVGIVAGLDEARDLLGETPQRVSTGKIDDDYWTCTHSSLRKLPFLIEVRSSILIYNGLIAEVRQNICNVSTNISGTA